MYNDQLIAMNEQATAACFKLASDLTKAKPFKVNENMIGVTGIDFVDPTMMGVTGDGNDNDPNNKIMWRTKVSKSSPKNIELYVPDYGKAEISYKNTKKPLNPGSIIGFDGAGSKIFRKTFNVTWISNAAHGIMVPYMFYQDGCLIPSRIRTRLQYVGDDISVCEPMLDSGHVYRDMSINGVEQIGMTAYNLGKYFTLDIKNVMDDYKEMLDGNLQNFQHYRNTIVQAMNDSSYFADRGFQVKRVDLVLPLTRDQIQEIIRRRHYDALAVQQLNSEMRSVEIAQAKLESEQYAIEEEGE